MCGICGVIDWSESPDATALVRRMTPTMLHRGPDDEGYLDSGRTKAGAGARLALGMRRLSIIDLAGGHQPIFNEDGTVGAVLNGEIYNFRELQKQLTDRGHSFRTRSDSEVVAHAYEEWGADCVERFQGMFAIAVYDRRETGRRGSEFRVSSSELSASGDGFTLFLARDRLGIKPLYYYAQNSEFRVSRFEFGVKAEAVHHRDTENSEAAQRRSDLLRSELETRNSKLETGGHFVETGGRFVFASEVRTLLASGVVPKRLSRSALESYLLFGSVSEPMTLVEGILSLPPGHRMTIRMNSSQTAPAAELKVESYWNVAREIGKTRRSTVNGNAKKTDARAAAAQVRTLLEESVRKHLIADVPVGVFLSSGIDSTCLAALASREVSGVHTFTVAFPEKEFNEAALARRTAEKLGTTHQEVILTGAEMLGRLSEAVGALDQPSMDGINTYFVSWSARQAGLKVALSGLGGDEVFGGYSTFRRTPQYQRLATFSNQVPVGVRSAAASLAGSAGGRFMSGDAARKIEALLNSPRSLPDPFYFGRALFTPAQVSELMNGATAAQDEPLWWQWLAESATQSRNLDPFAAVSCMELQSYLVSTLLRDTDSMSMAHSLEVRVPFLDHPLVEFVTQLPQELKVDKGIPKALLVNALDDLLPSDVVEQKKRGFTFPWASWLRGPLKEKFERGLAELSPALQETLNPERVESVWMNYLDGKTTWTRPWSLYVLNEWTKRHL
jgi:asparagine synthase (glutamine-hydrolysing)